MNKTKLLLVEDDELLCSAIKENLRADRYDVHIAHNAERALSILEANVIDVVISDVQMSGMDGHRLLENIKSKYPAIAVILMTAYGTIDKAVSAMQKGAADYLVKPFDVKTLEACIKNCSRRSPDNNSSPVCEDNGSIKLYQLAERVASSDVSVLINGESGSGKEVIARYIHDHSVRKNGPFVAINCAAIPENMLEAVLFGYEKGAFTGAHQMMPGKFEQAQGGTLLLDEISEMDLGLQAKILRVLQEKELERLGGRKTIKLDVRILATTNRTLREEVAGKRFREDLFYRLNVFPLTVTPLRKRKDDILPIAERMLAKYFKNTHHAVLPCLSDSSSKKLLGYNWPGNVRELENVIQRALVICGDVIDEEAICFESPLAGDVLHTEMAEEEKPLLETIKKKESELILNALSSKECSRKEIADQLGISPRTLRYKIAKMREKGMAIPHESRMISA